MNARLTLTIDEIILKKAKGFAKANHISLSKLVENYLSDLAEKEDGESISQSVKSISGVLHLPMGFDFKENRAQHLGDKY
ncbi:MAG: DUF6364 family protein [Bacteroidota bacterium]